MDETGAGGLDDLRPGQMGGCAQDLIRCEECVYVPLRVPRLGPWLRCTEPGLRHWDSEEPDPRDALSSHSQIFPDDQYFHLRHRGVAQRSLTPHWGHRLRLKKEPKVGVSPRLAPPKANQPILVTATAMRGL